MFRSTLLAATVMASCVYAQTYEWGDMANPSSNSAIIVEEVGEGGHVANVHFQNNLVPTGRFVPYIFFLEGAEFEAVVDHGQSDVPDRMYINLPEGYTAIPPEVVVNEGETKTIQIFNLADMLMG